MFKQVNSLQMAEIIKDLTVLVINTDAGSAFSQNKGALQRRAFHWRLSV